MNWYTQSESELREMLKEPLFREQMETRLAAVKTINEGGLRCHMSKKLEEKLTRVLGGL